jgi:hypothetical protein
MDRATSALVGICGVIFLFGCGRGEPGEAASVSAGASSGSMSALPTPPADPAARVAHDFLSSVLKGDTRRASDCLTPVAIQRLVESGKQFAPPGIDSATFRIGDVRKPSDDRALVQCFLTGADAQGQTRSEEMCCLLRHVDAQWRISGIAFSTGPNRPPTIFDFESLPSEPTMIAPTGASETGGQRVTPGRPSPPRTANEAAIPSQR